MFESPSTEARLRAKAKPVGDCLEWQGYRTRLGYGMMSTGERSPKFAHRVAWMLANGPIPKGLYILHRCDNPPCVRVEHLFIGNDRDNVLDCIAKGRRRIAPTQTGAANSSARLTEADVIEIRRLRGMGETSVSLAQRYGVRPKTIQRAARGESWGHVA